jgi:hypothetical protein
MAPAVTSPPSTSSIIGCAPGAEEPLLRATGSRRRALILRKRFDGVAILPCLIHEALHRATKSASQSLGARTGLRVVLPTWGRAGSSPGDLTETPFSDSKTPASSAYPAG